jgi:hypothetical protein
MGIQTLQKTFYKKNPCRKVFAKKNDKNPKPIFSRFLLSRFWAFLGEGSSKTRYKNLTKKVTSPGTFLASEEPTNHPKVRQAALLAA